MLNKQHAYRCYNAILMTYIYYADDNSYEIVTMLKIKLISCTRYNNGDNIQYQLDIWYIAHDGASIEQATKKVYKDY